MSNYYSIISSHDNDLDIQVLGTGTAIGTSIISYFMRYAVELVALGIKGIVLSVEKTKTTIKLTKKESETAYNIAVKEAVSLQFSQAITRAENNPYLRKEIKEKLMKELQQDLDDIFDQIRRELRTQR